MAKSEWGMKRTCRDCGAPFYDLKKKNIVCPKCGTVFDPAPPAKPKRSAPVEKPAPEPEAGKEEAKEEAKEKAKEEAPPPLKGDTDGDKVKTGAGKDDEDVSPEGDKKIDTKAGKDDGDDDGDDDDKDLIEDTSDLGRDDDDMSEVREHIDDGVEDKN